MPPYNPDRPMLLEVDFLNMMQCDRASRIAGVERSGPLTIQIAGGDPWEQYRVLWAALRAALYEAASFLK